MGGGDNDVFCASFTKYTDSASNGSASIDHVVQQDTCATLDITDDTVGGHLVSNVHVAGLVDEGQWSATEDITTSRLP